jgi:hypothetical protein
VSDERDLWLAVRSALVMLLGGGDWRRAALRVVRAVEKRYDLRPFDEE